MLLVRCANVPLLLLLLLLLTLPLLLLLLALVLLQLVSLARCVQAPQWLLLVWQQSVKCPLSVQHQQAHHCLGLTTFCAP
jgi:hypothetical protein